MSHLPLIEKYSLEELASMVGSTAEQIQQTHLKRYRGGYIPITLDGCTVHKDKGFAIGPSVHTHLTARCASVGEIISR